MPTKLVNRSVTYSALTMIVILSTTVLVCKSASAYFCIDSRIFALDGGLYLTRHYPVAVCLKKILFPRCVRWSMII